MSIYAKVNSQNIVENVIICEDSQIAYFDGEHIKVTNNTNTPYVGGEYRRDAGKFIEVKPPYDSWILNNELKWESPAGPQPDYNYDWDEENQEWINQPIKSE
jgi:hypothetical protein